MKYQVIVGNLGTAIDTEELLDAAEVYVNYCQLSRTGYGRVAYETVTLMVDGEPDKEMDMHGLSSFMINIDHREGDRDPVRKGILDILKTQYDGCNFEDSVGTELQSTLNKIEDICQILRKKLTDGEEDE